MPRERGLDPTYLAGIADRRLPGPDLAHIRRRIGTHLDAYDGYLSYSGGKDSLVILDLTLAVDHTVPIVFFDSGLEFPETRVHLDEVEVHFDVKIHRLQPRRPLLDLLAADGSWDHDNRHATPIDLHTALITEPARHAHQMYGPGVLWGVRAAESPDRSRAYQTALTCPTGCCSTRADRRRNHGGVLRRAQGTTAYGPVWDWSTEQVWRHLRARDLPINPLYAKLQDLGAPEEATRVSHVIDGLRLAHGRVTWLARGWPDLFNEIAATLPRLREFV